MTEPEVPVRWHLDMGLPDLTTFPGSALASLIGRSLSAPEPPLLYGGPGRVEIARGHRGLREVLAARMGLPSAEGVMLTSGAAQAVEHVYRAVLDRGDVVAVEAPTWGAAIRMGRILGAEPVAVPMDRDGMRIEELERDIARIEATGRRLRLVYTIATYHTPTGWSLSQDRRRRLLELAQEHDFLVIDDQVYGELRYEGPVLPPLAALAGGERVVTVGSFSKTIAPALRLGWLAAPPDRVEMLARRREDLGSSQLTAQVLERFVRSGDYDDHVARVCRIYRAKRDIVADTLHRTCGDAVRFDVPDGGMYFWVELADDIDGGQVMAHAKRGGVACRPGEEFFGDRGDRGQWFRMAFTPVPEDELLRGVRVLCDAVRRSGRQSA
jgi:2-aminoadipate transaminase